MKIFIALSESPLKVKKIAIYCLLILFLVPELLRILKRIKKVAQGTAQSWIKSIKLDKVCDAM